jgi:serine/threonine protein kinase/tetratricopeptide (TPR) repeat protein
VNPTAAPAPAADEALTAGTVLDGEYRVEGVLGSGGMGVVYRARDVRLDRPVAVKVHLQKGQAHERLAREATALARLSHPNVVSVYRVGTHEGRVYVAMELVEGGTLRRRKHEVRPWREVVRLHAAAGDGLAAAHAAGLVHRDYKPDNVLLGADGRPRVADFGLARASGERGHPVDGGTLATAETIDNSAPAVGARSAETSSEQTAAPDSEQTAALKPGAYLLHQSGQPTPLEARLTVTGAWVGTPAYMAPEQLDGAEVDARSDQFSFAVALWEALHGKRPFAGDTTLALRAAIARQQLEPGERNDVPGRVDDVLRRALREAPAERWPSMDAILVALRHDPGIRRRRIAVGAGALALAGATALAAWQVRGAASDRPSCDTGAADIAATWNAERSVQLRTRLTATGLPYAPALADHLIGALDDYAAGWAAGQDLACRARADRTWSAELADRAAACLARRRHAMTETVRVLGTLDGASLDDAPHITDRLPAIIECTDPAALAGADLPPSDPAKAQLRERASVALARAVTLNHLHDPLGLAAADEAVALAALVDQPNLRLEAAAARAEAAYLAGERDGSARFEQVYFDARAAGNEIVANGVALQLVHVALHQNRDVDAATWLRHAVAGVSKFTSTRHHVTIALARARIAQRQGNLAQAVKYLDEARLGLADEADADAALPDLLDLESGLLGAMGELDRAIAAGREAVTRTEARYGPRHPAIVSRLSNLALSLSEAGEHAEAAALMARGVAVCEPSPRCRDGIGVYLLNLGAVQVNAEQHEAALETLDRAEAAITGDSDQSIADRAMIAGTRGFAFDELGRPAEAELALRDALALSERAVGGHHPDVANVLNNLGNLLNREHRYDDAVPVLQRAVAIWAEVAPGANHAALPMIALGRAQLGLGRPALAATSFRAAIKLLEDGGIGSMLAVARYRLAQAQWQMGDRAGAHATDALIDLDGVTDPSLRVELVEWRKTLGATK